MEQSGVAMVIADPNLPDCPVVAVNQAFERLTGYSKKEALGRNCRFLQGEGTSSETVVEIRRALENRETAEFELLNYRKDGSAFWCSLHLSPIYDADGELSLFVSSQRDESLRVSARLELEETHRRLAFALQAARAVGTFDWNVTQDVLAVDAQFANVFNLDPAEAALGLPIGRYFDKIDKNDRERVKRAVRSACETGEPFEQEYGVMGSDGVQRFVVGRGKCWNWPDGHTHFTGVVIDITERRNAELALEQAVEVQRLTSREINHRIKNLFALIPAIVSLSARNAMDVESLAGSIQSRIAALSRSHSLTLEAATQSRGIDLAALIRAVVEPYDTGASITMSGPDFRLRTSRANAVALAVHEFVTNAVKYGALSCESGRLNIGWQLDQQGALIIDWNEQGVALSGAPTTSGFGTRLSDNLFRTFDGAIQRNWNGDGLRARLVVPAATFSEKPQGIVSRE